MNKTIGIGFVPPRFHIVDYLILAIMIIISLGIGIFYGCVGGKQRSTREYFKGSRSMGIIPVVLSLLASFISSTGMLGYPAEVYMFGYGLIYQLIGGFIGLPIAAYCFLPVFFDLQITSVFEYLERRFNRVIRICGALMSMSTLLFFASFVTYGPALALSQVTGFDLWGSILATTAIGTFYTSLGGIRAVMWADSAQMLMFTTALITVVVKGTMDLGGFSKVINTAIEGNRLHPVSFSFDPRIRFTFWGLLISSIIGWSSGYGVSQIQVQRYLTCPNIKTARKGIFLNFPGLALVDSLYVFVGLLLYAKYWDCDPISSKQIEAPDQIFPLFVMDSMANLIGLPGLFVAGVYCAALSSTSSCLNSIAAVVLEDFIRPCARWKNMKDETATKVAKCLAVGGGIFCLLIIALIKNLGSIVQTTYYLLGTTVGAGCGLFSLGVFVPKANTKGTLLGLICGIGIASWFVIGNQIYKPQVSKLPLSTENCADNLKEESLISKIKYNDSEIPEIYKISYMWIVPLAFIVTFTVGSLASLIIGSNKEEIDDKYLAPPIRYLRRKFFKSKTISKNNPPSYDTDADDGHVMLEASGISLNPHKRNIDGSTTV